MTQPDRPAIQPETQQRWHSLVVDAHSDEIIGNLDEAARKFDESGQLAFAHGMQREGAFSSVCLGNVLLQIGTAESYSIALELFKSALAIRLQLHAPCEWDVAETHLLLAQTYQLMEQYPAASECWRQFLRCVDWMPDYIPLIRNAAKELLYCLSKVHGLPEPVDYDGISAPPSWWQEDAA